MKFKVVRGFMYEARGYSKSHDFPSLASEYDMFEMFYQRTCLRVNVLSVDGK